MSKFILIKLVLVKCIVLNLIILNSFLFNTDISLIKKIGLPIIILISKQKNNISGINKINNDNDIIISIIRFIIFY